MSIYTDTAVKELLERVTRLEREVALLKESALREPETAASAETAPKTLRLNGKRS